MTDRLALYRAMLDQGMTRADIARSLGVTRQAVGQCLKWHATPKGQRPKPVLYANPETAKIARQHKRLMARLKEKK